MSVQTKEQALGYLLQASLRSSLPAKQLVDVAISGNKLIEDDAEMNNYETVKALNIIVENLEIPKELGEQIISSLHYTFDMRTVGEAQNTYNAFENLFPVLKG